MLYMKKTVLKSKIVQPVKKPTKKAQAKKPPIDVINKALKDHCGIITQTCRELNCTPATLYKWIKSSPKLEATVAEARGQFIDEAEHGLLKNIRAGKETSIIFTLKCLAKQRGYNQDPDIQINNNEFKQINIIVQDEETKQLLDNLMNTIDITNVNQKLLGDE